MGSDAQTGCRTTPLPMGNNPRVVFEQMFGDSGSTDPAVRRARMQRDRSILDSVTGRVADLKREVGHADSLEVDEYLEGVRDIVSPAEGVGGRQHAGPLAMDLDGPGGRVDQPVLHHAVSAVERVLVAPVPVGGGRGQYLDHQVGRTPHVLAAAQQMLAFPGDEQQVRLHDVGVGQDHVAKRQPPSTGALLAEPACSGRFRPSTWRRGESRRISRTAGWSSPCANPLPRYSGSAIFLPVGWTVETNLRRRRRNRDSAGETSRPAAPFAGDDRERRSGVTPCYSKLFKRRTTFARSPVAYFAHVFINPRRFSKSTLRA